MGDELHTETVVVGAGVVGLAIAARLAKKHEVILLESHTHFGQETSSRNSEVVHSGIYYPRLSEKTKLCVRGRDLLYAFCREWQVPHRACGKIVLAIEAGELARLEGLAKHATEVGVPCERWTGAQVRKAEPLVVAREGLFFPLSGIVDSHAFMATLERHALGSGAHLAYRHSVEAIERSGADWKIRFRSPQGKGCATASRIINAAGLAAAELSNAALGTSRYEHRYCRGRYFGLKSAYSNQFSHLVYPLPEKHGLGVHVTVDMAGQARLGPDTDWCATSSFRDRAQHYECDWEAERPKFLSLVRRYCPGIGAGDLVPGLVGIRPKLFIDGEPHPDFLLENLDGYIHGLGIESPGLTAALAIAERVEEIL